MTVPVLEVLRTARAYQQPPTAWVGGDGSWSDRDRVATLGHTIYESMLCHECGQPLSVCRDPGQAFELVTGTCGARAVIDQHQADQSRAKADPVPGQVLSARPEENATQFGANPFG